MPSIDRVKDSIVTTKGINSKVFGNNGKVVGHILLGDYDEHSCTYKRMLEETMDMQGINVVLESSEDCYHYWNLTVMSLDDTALRKLKLGDDSNHTRIGYKRGMWTLRTFPKNHEKKGVYKPAPTVEQVWVNQSPVSQSAPHLRYLQAMIEQQDKELQVNELDDIDQLQFAGDAHRMESYMSVMDDIKQEMREMKKGGKL